MYCKTVTESKLKTYQIVTKIYYFKYILLHECTYVVKFIKTCFVISAEQFEPHIHLAQGRFRTNKFLLNFFFSLFLLSFIVGLFRIITRERICQLTASTFLNIYNPEAEAQRSYAYALSLPCNLTRHARNSYGPLPQAYFERKTHKS